MAREAGLSNYLDGMPAEYVARLLASDAKTDVLERTTAIHHKPTLTPDISVSPPGQGPQPLALGNVIGLHYDTPATDEGFRILKIPFTLVSPGNTAAIEPSVSFHIHWTKGVNSDESGATVRWVFEYTLFDGHDDEITSPTVSGLINMDDTYDDAGTTTRIVHRTADFVVTGLIAGYYLGVKITNDAGNTTMLGGPVLISADMLWKGWINTNASTFDP